jgi:hypothetical protein
MEANNLTVLPNRASRKTDLSSEGAPATFIVPYPARRGAARHFGCLHVR